MTSNEQQKMMLAIESIFTKHGATSADRFTAAQSIGVNAIGEIVNKDPNYAATPDGNNELHRFAEAIANQIRTALHLRINVGDNKDL